jgi:hypothetical protein
VAEVRLTRIGIFTAKIAKDAKETAALLFSRRLTRQPLAEDFCSSGFVEPLLREANHGVVELIIGETGS